MDTELYSLVMELGQWPKNREDAKFLLKGSGWYYMPKTGAVKSNITNRVVHKPEWKEERIRLESVTKKRQRSLYD